MLSYRLPREPSGPRTTLWRRLRKLGVARVSDGLVALPADARTREQFEWAADDVIGAGGTAGVWLARPTTLAEYRERAIGRRDFFPPAARNEAAAALRDLERSLAAEPVR